MVGLPEAGFDLPPDDGRLRADVAVHVGGVDARIAGEVLMQDGGLGFDRLQDVHDRRQRLIGDANVPCRLFRRLGIGGGHRCQHGAAMQDFVTGKQGLILEVAAEAIRRRIPGCQHRPHTWQAFGFTGVHRHHPRMGVVAQP